MYHLTLLAIIAYLIIGIVIYDSIDGDDYTFLEKCALLGASVCWLPIVLYTLVKAKLLKKHRRLK